MRDVVSGIDRTMLQGVSIGQLCLNTSSISLVGQTVWTGLVQVTQKEGAAKA